MKNCFCVVWKLSTASAFEHLHFECVNLFSAFSINFSQLNCTSTQKRVFLGVEGFLGCSDPSWGFLTDKSLSRFDAAIVARERRGRGGKLWALEHIISDLRGSRVIHLDDDAEVLSEFRSAGNCAVGIRVPRKPKASNVEYFANVVEGLNILVGICITISGSTCFLQMLCKGGFCKKSSGCAQEFCRGSVIL